MRRIKLFLLLNFIIFTIQGQTYPKKVLLKGSSELTGLFYTDTYEIGSNSFKTKTTQIKFQPSIGKFVSHYFFLGIYTEYGYQNQSEYYEDSEDNKSSINKSLSIGPFARAYVADLKFAPFLHANLGYSRHSMKQSQVGEDDIPEIKMNGLNYGLGVGMEYFVDRKFTFEFLLSYSYLFVRDYVEEVQNAVSIESKGFEFRIGTSIFLN